MKWQKTIQLKKKVHLRLGLLLFLVLLFRQYAPFSFANTQQETLVISQKDFKILEDNLMELQVQFQQQEKIRLSLTTQLENASKELQSAKTSLSELENKINSQLNKKLWTGIGIGFGSACLIGLIVGLTIGLTK